MGWTPLFLQNQPFFGEKRLDQKTPEKSLIFQALKHEVFGPSKNGCFLKARKSITYNIDFLGKRLSQLNFNYKLEI